MRIETTKKLISNDGKSFNIGSDIAFRHNNNDYIVEIVDIGLKGFMGKNIEFNGRKIAGSMLFPIEEVSNCNYVYYD
jgi:hypothetical protein